MNRWFLSVLLCACQHPVAVEKTQMSLPVLEQQLQRLLPQAQACAITSDCRLLALGHRACGGPDRYVAYSVATSQLRQLEQLAQQHRELSAQAEQGRMGLCVVAERPSVSCQQQRCVTSSSPVLN